MSTLEIGKNVFFHSNINFGYRENYVLEESNRLEMNYRRVADNSLQLYIKEVSESMQAISEPMQDSSTIKSEIIIKQTGPDTLYVTLNDSSQYKLFGNKIFYSDGVNEISDNDKGSLVNGVKELLQKINDVNCKKIIENTANDLDDKVLLLNLNVLNKLKSLLNITDSTDSDKHYISGEMTFVTDIVHNNDSPYILDDVIEQLPHAEDNAFNQIHFMKGILDVGMFGISSSADLFYLSDSNNLLNNPLNPYATMMHRNIVKGFGMGVQNVSFSIQPSANYPFYLNSIEHDHGGATDMLETDRYAPVAYRLIKDIASLKIDTSACDQEDIAVIIKESYESGRNIISYLDAKLVPYAKTIEDQDSMSKVKADLFSRYPNCSLMLSLISNLKNLASFSADVVDVNNNGKVELSDNILLMNLLSSGNASNPLAVVKKTNIDTLFNSFSENSSTSNEDAFSSANEYAFNVAEIITIIEDSKNPSEVTDHIEWLDTFRSQLDLKNDMNDENKKIVDTLVNFINNNLRIYFKRDDIDFSLVIIDK